MLAQVNQFFPSINILFDLGGALLKVKLMLESMTVDFFNSFDCRWVLVRTDSRREQMSRMCLVQDLRNDMKKV